MAKKVIFSGIQPSGNLHIGNYIGAIKQWLPLQNVENELIFCIVDLHAITVKQDPKVLRENILELAAIYLACGIDPEKAKIFVQSENADHPYLAWIFNCITPMGWMERMTQFKDKSKKQGERTSLGLFSYPTLMATDILLYDPDLIPVGEDQVQHIEFTRDVADKFNKTFGETFKLPKAQVDQDAARIMSLQTPGAKMSKSDNDPKGTINLLDSVEEIENKVKRAVTDSGTHISFDNRSEALENLIVIYAKLSDRTPNEIAKEFEGKSYGEFKQMLSDLIVTTLEPIQKKYNQIREDKSYLKKVLDKGLNFAKSKSSKKITQVKEAIGLGY